MSTCVISIEPTNFILPNANFADCYQLELDGQNLDAESATRRVMGRNLRWIATLMKLGNFLVAPLGLKAAPDERLVADRLVRFHWYQSRLNAWWSML